MAKERSFKAGIEKIEGSWNLNCSGISLVSAQ
jgi:hypothetical protein